MYVVSVKQAGRLGVFGHEKMLRNTSSALDLRRVYLTATARTPHAFHSHL